MEPDTLDTLADLPLAEQLRTLAAIADALIRDVANDHHEARDAVNKLLVLIERSAGLHL